ncbi:MAG: class II fructose-bisphosphate aldolase, partial [Spirochaetia bacterium]
MSIVTNKQLLDHARAGRYAVAAFNTNNLEYTQAILAAAAELRSPVIISAAKSEIDYMDGYRIFTWNPKSFPNPSGLLTDLAADGFRVAVIVDPGIKYQPPVEGAHDASSHPELAPQDKSYYVYNQGKAQDFYLKRK